MCTNPENQLVNVLSQWLARHVDDAELTRGDLEMVVRETFEAVAPG
jgi:hypothetical protein